MKKVLLFISALSLSLSYIFANKAETDAIYVWLEGDSTCYQLSENPRVVYEGNDAVLFVNDEEQLRLTLTDGAQLKVTFGQYMANGIDDVEESPVVKQNGKFLYGGRVIIIKDGVKYDIYGKIITE